MWIDYSKMAGWKLVKEIAVGGLEWVGFSKTDTGKLLCISSQKTTLIDCFSGEVLPCNCEYDEETRIAYCDELPDEEIGIAGYYGGQLPDCSIQGDSVSVNEGDLRWNSFIEDVYCRDIASLSETQKKAVLCFWYDSEMNSGGFSGFADCYPDIDTRELAEAISTVGYKEIADNYLKAATEGENDDWLESDNAYYNFSPSLCDCLQKYIENNKDIIFK